MTAAEIAVTAYLPPAAAKPWRLSDLYAPARMRLYRLGRHALADALRSAGGGPVLFPSFFCREVLSAAPAAGGRGLFYTVGPDLQPNEDSSLWPLARAVVAVDFFGFPADLAPFRAYARRTGAILIEDASHALFSRDENGRLLGLRADCGVLSPRKTLPLPEGGALVAPAAPAQELPPAPKPDGKATARARLKAAARPLLAAMGAKTARGLLEAFRAARGFDWKNRAGQEGDETEPLGDPRPHAALSKPIVCGDEAGERARRRALFELCAETARGLDISPLFSSLPKGIVPYAFAFRAAPGPAEAAYAAYRRLGLSVLPWPALPEAVRASAPEHYKNVYLTHFLW